MTVQISGILCQFKHVTILFFPWMNRVRQLENVLPLCKGPEKDSIMLWGWYSGTGTLNTNGWNNEG